MQIESIEDTKRLLRDWGRWARERIGTEHLPCRPEWRQGVTWDPVVYEGHFDDDMAMAVDGAIAQLRFFDLHSYQLVVDYYRDNHSDRSLAALHNKPRTSLQSSLRMAEGYLSGVILTRLQAAA